MIANAKEFYPRSSSIFDDAERIRKTLSNYMTKNNPAYNKRGYQAFPTPLPPRNDEEEDDEDEEDDDGQDEAEDDEEEEDDDDDEEPTSRRRSIVVKRGRGRPRKSDAVESPKPAAAPSHSDHDQEYLNVPYKSLNFQRAQEKVVEEVLRHQEPEYEGPYFEPFINLPPRALKDYYRIVADPLSLRKLQKIVKGTQSRYDTPGVSEFKNWAAFEERSQLLWDNAYFYNEEGSEIYELARELEVRSSYVVNQVSILTGGRKSFERSSRKHRLPFQILRHQELGFEQAMPLPEEQRLTQQQQRLSLPQRHRHQRTDTQKKRRPLTLLKEQTRQPKQPRRQSLCPLQYPRSLSSIVDSAMLVKV